MTIAPEAGFTFNATTSRLELPGISENAQIQANKAAGIYAKNVTNSFWITKIFFKLFGNYHEFRAQDNQVYLVSKNSLARFIRDHQQLVKEFGPERVPQALLETLHLDNASAAQILTHLNTARHPFTSTLLTLIERTSSHRCTLAQLLNSVQQPPQMVQFDSDQQAAFVLNELSKVVKTLGYNIDGLQANNYINQSSINLDGLLQQIRRLPFRQQEQQNDIPEGLVQGLRSALR
jgi:hypothetical protein